jgi:hypothetical protein
MVTSVGEELVYNLLNVSGINGGAKIDHETPGKRRFMAAQK